METIPNALNEILKLRGVLFEWKKGNSENQNLSDRRQVGFIAQEVKNVFPEIVSKDGEGFYSVAYAQITPVVVEAIKEQNRIIERQKIQLGELQSRVNRLEFLLEQLQTTLRGRAVP